ARVKFFESLDRLHLRRMDHVVCVSEGQAAKVRRAGVSRQRLSVIHNAIDMKRFNGPKKSLRVSLTGLFVKPPRFLVAAAGRLSPEKGFGVLVDAAARVLERNRSVG